MSLNFKTSKPSLKCKQEESSLRTFLDHMVSLLSMIGTNVTYKLTSHHFETRVCFYVLSHNVRAVSTEQVTIAKLSLRTRSQCRSALPVAFGVKASVCELLLHRLLVSSA